MVSRLPISMGLNEMLCMKRLKHDTMYQSTWEKQSVDKLYYLIVVELVVVNVIVEEGGEGNERVWKKIFLWRPETRSRAVSRNRPANARYRCIPGVPLNMCIRYLSFSPYLDNDSFIVRS